MSIKSDRWIRRMALDHAMIRALRREPGAPGGSRWTPGDLLRRLIYGYDMRVAPEFKIFTNVLSAVVDPKDFDARSFVEYEGDICIVPPNSFALARASNTSGFHATC